MGELAGAARRGRLHGRHRGGGDAVPARALLEDLLLLCRPHAEALGCAAELDSVVRLADRTGARRQLELSRKLDSLPQVVAVLADDFLAGA